MNDVEIACFQSVARTGSFTASARELGSTQQAVSRNIQSLEEELGFPLFNRGTPLCLTWGGERFLRLRVEADEQLSSLESRSRRLTEAGRDELFVGWNDWTGCPQSLEADIRAFCEAYPHVRLHARQGSTEEIADMLSGGSLDIAVLPEYCTHSLSGMSVSAPFTSVPLCVLSRELTALPSAAELSDIRQLAAPMGEANEDAVRRRIHRFGADMGLVPRRLDILPDVRSILTELLCGGCFTIAPEPFGWECLSCLPIPGQELPLVFVTAQAQVGPWVSLLDSFIRQRRTRL